MGTFATRTVRNGRVKINGSYYYPSTHKDSILYTNQLEGLTLVFGLYGEDREFVSLWGDKALAEAKTQKQIDKAWKNQPHHIEGHIAWECWRK